MWYIIHMIWLKVESGGPSSLRLYCSPHMGHSSQYHRGSVLRVLRFPSNFHHWLVSRSGANPENFSLKAFSNQFLLVFKDLTVASGEFLTFDEIGILGL